MGDRDMHSKLPTLKVNNYNKTISINKNKSMNINRNISNNILHTYSNIHKNTSNFNVLSTENNIESNKNASKIHKFRSYRKRDLNKSYKINSLKMNLNPQLSNRYNKSISNYMTIPDKDDVDFVLNLNTINNVSSKEMILVSQNVKKNVDENIEVLNQRLGKSQKRILPRISLLNQNFVSKLMLNRRNSNLTNNNNNTNGAEYSFNMKAQKAQKERWEEIVMGKLEGIRKDISSVKQKKKELHKKFFAIIKEIEDLGIEKEILSSNYIAKQLYSSYEKKLIENKNEDSPTRKNIFDSPERSDHGSRRDSGIFDYAQKEKLKFRKNVINMNDNNIRAIRKPTKKETKLIQENEKSINNFILNTLKAKDRKEKNYRLKEVNALIKKGKAEYSEIEEKIEELNKKLNELKEKENGKINLLMNHYKETLYAGVDARADGLIWVIKAIWRIGKNVPLDYFPSFLDEKSIRFLFEYAHGSLLLEEYKEETIKLKIELKKNVNEIIYHNLTEIGSNQKEEEDKLTIENGNNIQDMQRKTTKNLMNLTHNLKEHNLNYSENKKNSNMNSPIKAKFFKNKNPYDMYSTSLILVNYDGYNNYMEFKRKINENQKVSLLKYVDNILAESPKIHLEKMDKIKQLSNLEKNISDIEKKLNEIKKKETERIFKEFIERNYSNRYNVVIEVAVAALFGERNKPQMIQKYERLKKEFMESIKNIRFFDYLRNRNRYKSVEKEGENIRD